VLREIEGDCVGIMLPASVGADILVLAALFSGKTPVMVNWTSGARNVRHGLDITDCRSVVTARQFVRRIASMGADLSAVEECFVFMEDIGGDLGLLRKLGAWLRARLSWGTLEKTAMPETAAILFTSGSESRPKAVPLTHRNILSNIRDIRPRVEVSGADRLLGILPPFHSFGLTCTIALPLVTGLPVIHHPNPTEGAMLSRLIEAYKATIVMGTPTFLDGILRTAKPEQLASLRLAVTGAEKCPDRVYDAFAELCPEATVLEGYGVTECSPIVSVNEADNPKRGTVGKVLPSFEYDLANPDTGAPVDTGERGELLLRGPCVFPGYIGREGASPFIEHKGKDDWYRTGDLLSEDADGVLTFRGRLKRFAKLGGEMISLPAIEEVLNERCASEDEEGPSLAVEVTADEEQPELVLFTTRDLDRETVNGHIQEAGLSSLHKIRRVRRVKEIPLLGTGKVHYRALRDRLKQDEASDDA
jgi:long-chain-fatty-acid--[acyl-carrier-protein] ligase